MKKTYRLWLTLLAVLVASLLTLGMTAAAEGAPTLVDRGYCGGEGDGDNLTWTLETDGTLTVSGKGAMADYLPKVINNTEGYTLAPWGDYYNDVQSIVIEDGVTSVGTFAFCRLGATGVTIPDSVISIGRNAFWYCTDLERVKIPAGIKEIEQYTFASCDGLSSVEFPDNLNVICFAAFWGCDALTTVVVPAHVMRVEDCAFYSKSQPKKVVILSPDCYLPASEGIVNGELAVIYAPLGSATETHVKELGYSFIPICPTDYTHSMTKQFETAPTCTTDGHTAGWYCEDCGRFISGEAQPAFGHAWGEWEVIKQATTEETGLIRRVCANDASHVEEREIPKLELDENDEPTGPIQAFIESITHFFRGIIDWFLRLFRRP